jgi:hypothetical protein
VRIVPIIIGVLVGALGWGVVGTSLHAQEGDTEQAAPAGDGPLWQQPGKCETCHVEADWWVIQQPPKAEGFDHTATGFALRDAHESIGCEECHRQGLEALSPQCQSCHHDPHAGFRNVTCQECHDERSWRVARNFTFHERTRFPLTGAHASIRCEACHRQRRGEPAGFIPTECFVCHARDFRTATPDHLAAGFTECGACHTTDRFKGADYVHQTYQLLGSHAFADCNDCHTGSAFAGLANAGNDCFSCHADEYADTVQLSMQPGSGIPNHPASNFPTTCAMAGCHTNAVPVPTTWDILGNPGS